MATQFGNNNSGNSAIESISYGSSTNFGNFSAPAAYLSGTTSVSLTGAQAALGTATAVHAAVADNAAIQTITTGFTQPAYPRNLVVTPSGTAANVTAKTVVVNGTDSLGQAISESFLLTAGALTAAVGVKAFKTVISVVQPIIGASVSVSVGTGNVLGFPSYLYGNTVLFAFLNNVKEGTLPTVVTSLTSLANNTFTLNSSLNGTPVNVSFLPAFDQSLVG